MVGGLSLIVCVETTAERRLEEDESTCTDVVIFKLADDGRFPTTGVTRTVQTSESLKTFSHVVREHC